MCQRYGGGGGFAEETLNSGHLKSRLHGGDGGGAERAGVRLISAAVGLANAQEENAGGQTGRQRQGAVSPEVCTTERERERERAAMAQ